MMSESEERPAQAHSAEAAASAAKAGQAAAYFAEGYNCAQSVLRAVAEAEGFSCPQCIPAVAMAMGGGIGHTGRACGALTGAVLALGLAADRRLPGDLTQRKRTAYELAGSLVDDFSRTFGSADCEALLGFSWREPQALDRFRREKCMDEKCTPYVRWAAAEVLRIIGGMPKAGKP